jgi:DHA1 family multidrug resistance protein-like MFS transporter
MVAPGGYDDRPVSGTVAARAASLRAAIGAWLERWTPILPLLFAEFVLWTGFGALLPVMPLYLRDHGVDLALLGVVIAAWPATRLVAEPVFGWLADRTARVPIMVGGLLIASLATGLLAILSGVAAFIALRALSGLGTAIYDPAARGYLIDATPPDRRGEVFGLYNAAQMGGILLGPAIGGVGAAWFGGFGFTIAFGAFTILAAAVAVATRVRESPRVPGAVHEHGVEEGPGVVSEFPVVGGLGPAAARAAGSARVPPRRLLNRLVLAAVVASFAGYLTSGIYETVWSLFLEARGGGLELIGLTFAVFGLTTIVVSPAAGRLVDRAGPLPFVAGGLVVMAVTMVTYTVLPDPRLAVAVIVVEAIGFSFHSPAMFTVVAAGSPAGRSSTAQGLVGAAGTLGTIASSLATGLLAARDINLPFLVGAVVVLLLLLVTMAIGWRPIKALRPTG